MGVLVTISQVATMQKGIRLVIGLQGVPSHDSGQPFDSDPLLTKDNQRAELEQLTHQHWTRSRITREAYVQEESLKPELEDKPSPEQIHLWREEFEAVKRAFKQLSPKMQLVVHLIKEDGLSYDEVAEQLGIESSSVRRLVARAMEFLLEEVIQESLKGPRRPPYVGTFSFWRTMFRFAARPKAALQHGVHCLFAPLPGLRRLTRTGAAGPSARIARAPSLTAL